MTTKEIHRLIEASRRTRKTLQTKGPHHQYLSEYIRDLRIALRDRKAADRLTEVAK